ncbi:hypothetical protein VNI00_014656 [Paramarasmius palmivorus]|uniref:Cytochrome P450 n=1 Tax=Paramarasmius palmivorus TaxID=297713 RepID=A0AAW0BTP8_9AGAR
MYGDGDAGEEELHILLSPVSSDDFRPHGLGENVGSTALWTAFSPDEETFSSEFAYGYKAKDTEDEIVRAANDAMETLSKAIAPGAFLVNQIPILRFVPEWFPGAGFKKTARIWAPLYDAMIDVPFNFAVEQLTAGTAEDSFTSKWLLRNLSGEDKDILKHGAGAMFGAGGETTAIALYTFFLQMCLNPDVQKRGQAEVDRIVGRERLPTCEDRENMPYIEALAQEILRWHIVVPTGLPHSTTQDDVHDGFFIPKGSIVLANIWKMSRDPHVYKNPEVFNPDRFLGPEPEQDPRDYVYGFGRRVCPGRHLANTTLFITLAMCLSVFDIAPIEEDGQVILPQYKPKSGTVSHLEEFKCRITPRIDEEKLAHLLQE